MNSQSFVDHVSSAEWDTPEDPQAFWVVDVAHCPAPTSQLDFDLRLRPMVVGTNRVYEHYGVPIRLAPKLVHGFLYQKLIDVETPADALPEVLNEADACVREVSHRLALRWEQTWLPEIKAHLAALMAFNRTGASLPALLAHASRARERFTRLWEIHAALLIPSLVALNDFDEAYRDLLPDAKPLDVYAILAGFPNKTVEANLRLWELGRLAAKAPSMRALFTEHAADELPARLSETPTGRALQGEIDRYARVYGERNDDLYIDKPTWVEDPSPIFRSLRDVAQQPDRDLTGELSKQAKRREELLRDVRAKLSSRPTPVVDEFEALLTAAQTATVLSEDHHFWIDCKITYHARGISLEIGRRLAECGALEAAKDIFFFTLEELSAIEEPAAASGRLRAVVAERRAAAARTEGVTPPPFLGVPRPILPMDCAILRAGAKFSGGFFGPPGEEGELKGMPGSSGRVRGRARLVRTPQEAERLQPGDILVAPFTLPSWTPFFASAAGIVTDQGGMLCHAAVVAREYGLPAVVGTQRAMATLRDGETIEVDGDAGIVRVLGP